MTIDWSQMRLAQDLDATRLRLARDAALGMLAEQVEVAAQDWGQGVPMVERLGWASKEAAARAFVVGQADAEQKALILTEAESSGDTPDDLAQLILHKSARYSAFVAKVTGERRRVARQLDAAETVAGIAAIMAEVRAALSEEPVDVVAP